MNRRQKIAHESIYPISIQELFSLITKKESFKRLLTPSSRIKLLQRDEVFEKGSKTSMSIKVGPFTTTYSFFCIEKKENELIIIKQGLGLFKEFQAIFRFNLIDKKNTKFSEVFEYYLPTIPFLTRILENSVRKQINTFLTYREKTLHKDLYYKKKYPIEKMKIAISGTNGLIGSELKCFFKMLGATVFSLVRAPSTKTDEIFYDFNKHLIQADKLEGLDCVIHLAGKPITLNPTEANFQEISQSRIASTKLITEAINLCKKPPKAFLCASAIGLYESNANYIIDEGSSCGQDRLSKICQEWEAAANACKKTRVINLRFAPVLSPKNGFLAKILKIAKTGLFPVIGDGAQVTSWISIDDVLYQILHIIYHKKLDGPINLSTPNFISQKNLIKTICKFIQRPQILRIPKPLIKLFLPRFTQKMLLTSQKIYPAKLSESGAEFAYPHIENTLAHFFSNL